jgi:hypothetical protein
MYFLYVFFGVNLSSCVGAQAYLKRNVAERSRSILDYAGGRQAGRGPQR